MTDRRAIRRGAVLYDRRPKTRRLDPTSERALVHVTGVYEETTTGNRLIKLQDGTHTHYQMLHAVDLTDSFIPAGWSFPIGRKPTYHLTRNCGVDDKADLMTDGGEGVGQAIEHDPAFRGEKPQTCPYCGGDLEKQSGTNGMYQCKDEHGHQWALVIEGTPSGDTVCTLISREGVAVRE